MCRVSRSAFMLACMFITALFGAAISLHADAAKALPDFDVTATDGSVKHTAQIVRTGKWLLIFVRPNCPPCATLLSSLDASSTQDGSRIAVIVKATTPAGLAALKAEYPNLAHSEWYADVHAKAASALMVPASPTTLGMRGGQVSWRLTGAISALPTGELSAKQLQPVANAQADQPQMRQHAIVNGWLTQP